MPSHNAQQRLDALPVIPAAIPDDGSEVRSHASSMPSDPGKDSPADTSAMPQTATSRDGRSPDAARLTPDEARLLRAVQSNTGRKAGDYAKLARMGAKKCSDTRLELVRRGLLTQEPVQLKSRGRNALVVTLTDAGHRALEAAV